MRTPGGVGRVTRVSTVCCPCQAMQFAAHVSAAHGDGPRFRVHAVRSAAAFAWVLLLGCLLLRVCVMVCPLACEGLRLGVAGSACTDRGLGLAVQVVRGSKGSGYVRMGTCRLQRGTRRCVDGANWFRVRECDMSCELNLMCMVLCISLDSLDQACVLT